MLTGLAACSITRSMTAVPLRKCTAVPVVRLRAKQSLIGAKSLRVAANVCRSIRRPLERTAQQCESGEW